MNKYISTSDTFPEKNILESLGTVNASTVIGMNLFKDFFSSITDIVGGESSSYKNALDESINIVIGRLQIKANAMGANGIVSLRIDTNEISGQGKSMVMVTAYGTAVLTENVTHTIEESQRIISLKITNIINSFNYDNLCDYGNITELRDSFDLSPEAFNTMFSELIEKRKYNLKNTTLFDNKEISFSDEAKELIEGLKEDEMLVKMKKTNEFQIIKKSKYEGDVELRLPKNYQVIFKNIIK